MTAIRRSFAIVILFAILCSLLAACQPAPAEDPATLASTPSSSDITPPPSSIPPTVPTTQPTAPVDVSDGRAFIYEGPQFVILSPDWRPSEALVDHLYWVIRSTKECVLICDEPIACYTSTDSHIYFVKESEPTNIYVTTIGDFNNHKLCYESTYGKVSYMTVITNSTDYLQFVADKQKFAMLDIEMGESVVLMEQHYINNAYMLGAGDGVTWNNWIWFQGKPTENDPPDWQYFYYRDTGKIEIDNTL